MTREHVFEFPTAPLSKDDDVFGCVPCWGDGDVELLLPAGPADLEPNYRTERCDECDGSGHVDEVGCYDCGADLSRFEPIAMVERVVHTTTTFAYCGPCAWAQVVED